MIVPDPLPFAFTHATVLVPPTFFVYTILEPSGDHVVLDQLSAAINVTNPEPLVFMVAMFVLVVDTTATAIWFRSASMRA